MQFYNKKKYNPSCIEYWNYDYDLYYNRLNKISNSRKIGWQNGEYNNVYFTNTRKQSKEEILFFEFVTETIKNIKHIPFSIFCKDKNNIVHKAIYDGYYKINNNIILIEYDGHYWHDEIKDNIRDNKTLLLRNDIIGIIRIQCKYYKKNKNKIVNKIYEGITEIKSEKKKIVKLY